jgi:hypothetical protein
MSTLKGKFYITSKNRVLRYELKPNISVGHISVNSDGFRAKEYSIPKPKGTFRIILLGDSEAFSQSLSLNDTFAKKLESRINEICKDRVFEILNMGVEGYNTIQELEFLKYKALKYQPDSVILYYCFNDPDYPEYYFKKNFFTSNFLTIRYTQYRFKKMLVKRDRRLKNIKSEEDNFRYLYTHETWEYTKDAILELSELSKKQKFKFVLVITPEVSSAVYNFTDKYPYWYINGKIASLKNENVEVIDPTYFLKEQNSNPLDLVMSPEDRHKNAKYNSLIASYISDELITRKIISCK